MESEMERLTSIKGYFTTQTTFLRRPCGSCSQTRRRFPDLQPLFSTLSNRWTEILRCRISSTSPSLRIAPPTRFPWPSWALRIPPTRVPYPSISCDPWFLLLYLRNENDFGGGSREDVVLLVLKIKAQEDDEEDDQDKG